MFDAVKNYLSLASGITEVTRQRALAAARALVSSGEATAEQVTSLAEDLVEASRSNREAAASLVRYETDRALGRLGLATADEVASLTKRVQALETAVRALEEAGRAGPGPGAGKARAARAGAGKAGGTTAGTPTRSRRARSAPPAGSGGEVAGGEAPS